MNNACRRLLSSLCALLFAGSAALLISCSGDSAETLIRNVTLIVAGFYTPVEGATTLPSNQTGNRTTSLNVTQAGDQLDAVDNNGLIFRGTLGQVTEDQASFTLEGQTTAGQEVTIAGTITVPEGSTEASMQGTWIEPSLFAAFAAEATVPRNNPPMTSTNGTGNGNGGDALSVSPTSATITNNTGTASFTASGGAGGFEWTLSSQTFGSVSPATGSSVTYTRDEAGNNTLRVTDDANEFIDITILQP